MASVTDSAWARLISAPFVIVTVRHPRVLRLRRDRGLDPPAVHRGRAGRGWVGRRRQPGGLLDRGDRGPADDRPHRRPLRPPLPDGRGRAAGRGRHRHDRLRPLPHHPAPAPGDLGRGRGRAVRGGGDPDRRPLAVGAAGRGSELLLPGRVRRPGDRPGRRRGGPRQRPLSSRLPGRLLVLRRRGPDRARRARTVWPAWSPLRSTAAGRGASIGPRSSPAWSSPAASVGSRRSTPSCPPTPRPSACRPACRSSSTACSA